MVFNLSPELDKQVLEWGDIFQLLNKKIFLTHTVRHLLSHVILN